MTKGKLQIGDVIRLEKGMAVFAKVPRSCYYTNCPFSEEMYTGNIIIGEIYQRCNYNKNSMISFIIKAMEPMVSVTEKQAKLFADSLNLDFTTKSFDTSIYVGEYVVTDTVSEVVYPEGHFTNTNHYPDGWKVTCKKKNNPSIEVSFYQTGDFLVLEN